MVLGTARLKLQHSFRQVDAKATVRPNICRGTFLCHEYLTHVAAWHPIILMNQNAYSAQVEVDNMTLATWLNQQADSLISASRAF